MARVILQNVSKLYPGNIKAVDRMSLEVTDGELMVIVGPSGCGKTTLLRMIAGLEDLTEGDITIGDRTVNEVSPKERDVAMVFQNYALYPHMTVFQNMAFALKLRKIPSGIIKTQVCDTAELLGIEKLLQRKPKALSGGQRQRVALGRAIVRNPQVFLFDEPLSNLDAKLRMTTRTELKALHRSLKTTSIYVTHDQAEAMTLGDRICVMYNGVQQQTAGPMEVYNKPANRFVAGFLGTPAMNFFDGIIKEHDSRLCFEFNECSIPLPQHFTAPTSKYIGQEIVMGIRPENLLCRSCAPDAYPTISATVQVVEPLGDKQEVYFNVDNHCKFVAIFSPHRLVRVDERMEISINPETIHLFELGEMGRNILF